jgi:hypothetical protein
MTYPFRAVGPWGSTTIIDAATVPGARRAVRTGAATVPDGGTGRDQSLTGWAPDDPLRLRVYGEVEVPGDICR